MKLQDAKKLWDLTAIFYLQHVKGSDENTISDVLALMDWPDERESLKWAAKFGPDQVFASARMSAGVKLAWLLAARQKSNKRSTCFVAAAGGGPTRCLGGRATTEV
jgi:hypothetical protein